MLKNPLTIAGTPVGREAQPYIVAEAGSNFNQSLDTARKLIDVAVEAGADAVKFQLFRADKLYPNGGELYDIFKSIELDPEWVPLLADHARQADIHFVASAFDHQSLDLLETVGVPFHKIASSETTNLGFVHRVASTGKPVVISTGMCDMVDVEEAVNVCLGVGNDNVVLMHCGALYPLPPEQANLQILRTFADRFGCVTGFSDHTLGQTAAAAAVGVGGSVFEKHFTLDRNSEGPDHFYAVEPPELKDYVAAVREAHRALGAPEKTMLQQEREIGRREGLYTARAMQAGEVLTANDVTARRPALGLRARYAPAVVGARLTAAIEADQPLTWDKLDFGEA